MRAVPPSPFVAALALAMGAPSAAARAATNAAAVQEAGVGAEPILVLAAASLTDVLPRLAEAWESAGGRGVRFSFAATSRLAPQALQGAPADVFVSADLQWMDWLRERGGVRGTPRTLFRNALVVVVPAGRSDAPRSPGELARDTGVVALAGENVPAGRYARAALEGAGVWSAVGPRVVRGGSVRGALEWVARGEAAAGIVYATDARADPSVEVAFRFVGEAAPTVTYSGAVVAGADDPDQGEAFLEFLGGPAAAAILTGAGFQPARGGAAPPIGPAPGPQPGESGPNPVTAVRISVAVGLLTALLGLLPAVGVGWLLARRTFPGKTLVTTLVLAPLVLPPVVTGFLLLALLGREGPLAAPLAALGVSVPFTPAAPVLAALAVGFPLYVVAVRGAFEAVDPRYEEVSWTLGTPPFRTFLRVSMPLALPGVAAGAVLAFARALGEFGATIVLAGNVEGRTRTIALAVYTLLESPGSRGRMWGLVGASVAVSLAALAGYEALSRRQRRRLEDRHGA